MSREYIEIEKLDKWIPISFGVFIAFRIWDIYDYINGFWNHVDTFFLGLHIGVLLVFCVFIFWVSYMRPEAKLKELQPYSKKKLYIKSDDEEWTETK